MPERHVPVLELCCPLLNVEEAHMKTLETRLLEGTGHSSVAGFAVQNLLHAASGLRTILITRKELLFVQRYLGADAEIDDEEIKELSTHLEQRIADSGEVNGVSALPTEFYRSGEMYTLALGNSPDFLRQREIAKLAIAEFLEIDSIPERIWLHDNEKITRVWLGTAHNNEEVKFLNPLQTILAEEVSSSEEESFPNELVFGQAEARRWHKVI